MRTRILAFFCIFTILSSSAQNSTSEQIRTEISIDFRVNQTVIDRNFGDNASNIQKIEDLIKYVQSDTAIKVSSIWFCGTASPEGSYELNSRLAHERRISLENIIRNDILIPDELIQRDDAYIPWDRLISMVEQDSTISSKQAILDILRGPSKMVKMSGTRKIDSRINALKRLEGGRLWAEMNRRYFSPLRNASVVIVTDRAIILPEPEPEPAPEPDPIPEPEPEPEPIPEPVDTVVVDTVPAPAPIEWHKRIYVKTNAVGWGMLIGNIAGEIDLDQQWSVTLPVYYSALNYFTRTIKFRTLAFQPEVRYWFTPAKVGNDGWFVGAHLGLAYFNYAADGEFRYQDHNGKSPAWGGGISAGYRLPISDNDRWRFEAAIGAGVYRLHYDKFRNEPNGQLVSTHKKTFFGIDRVALSIVYTFDLNNKGGNE